jgi:hypothetical protein
LFLTDHVPFSSLFSDPLFSLSRLSADFIGADGGRAVQSRGGDAGGDVGEAGGGDTVTATGQDRGQGRRGRVFQEDIKGDILL